MPSQKKKKSKKKSAEKISDVCCFCSTNVDDEIHLGALLKHEDITVHYFCMLFSSGLAQRGEDEEGILGFLPSDIKREYGRGQRLKCFYCKQYGATIGCSSGKGVKCIKGFHLPCGLKENSLHQFYGTFNSYCRRHRPIQKNANEPVPKGSICPICRENIDNKQRFKFLRSPCCNAIIHFDCISKQALNAGFYFFKCPLCNDKEQFQREMLEFGVYVPERDATWETEPNAFQELYSRHNQCDDPKCKCPDGKNYNGVGSRWEIILCNTCGAQGIHVYCGKLSWCKPVWECEGCVKIEKKKKQSDECSIDQSVPNSPIIKKKKKEKSRKRKRKSKNKSKSNEKKKRKHCNCDESDIFCEYLNPRDEIEVDESRVLLELRNPNLGGKVEVVDESSILREILNPNIGNTESHNVNSDNDVEIDVISIDDDDDSSPNTTNENIFGNFPSRSGFTKICSPTIKKSTSNQVEEPIVIDLLSDSDSESEVESVVPSEVDPGDAVDDSSSVHSSYSGSPEPKFVSRLGNEILIKLRDPLDSNNRALAQNIGSPNAFDIAWGMEESMGNQFFLDPYPGFGKMRSS